MPKRRSKKAQSEHNRKVRRIANRLKHAGWVVKADIEGFEQPTPIGRHKKIPDIEARKKGATRLLEVETENTVVKDKAQQSTFRRSAAQRDRTTFEVVIAGKTFPKKKPRKR